MIRTTCPQCGREDAVADYLASLPVLCKSCGHRVTMGEAIAPPKPAPPPAAPPPPQPAVQAPAAPPPPPAPKPLAKPEPSPAVALAPPPVRESSDTPHHTNGIVYPSPPKPPRWSTKPDVTEYTPISQPGAAAELLSAPPVVIPRGRRLAARLITLLGAVLALVAGFLLVGFAPKSLLRDQTLSTVLLLVPVVLYGLYNLVLLGTQGQDFGKRALKLRIAGEDGTPARFGRAFLKRELVVLLLLAGLIPLAWKLYKHQQAGELAGMWQRSGWQMFMPNRMAEVMPAIAAVLFSLLNALMIFNKDGKCIHDRLAKTTVVRG